MREGQRRSTRSRIPVPGGRAHRGPTHPVLGEDLGPVVEEAAFALVALVGFVADAVDGRGVHVAVAGYREGRAVAWPPVGSEACGLGVGAVIGEHVVMGLMSGWSGIWPGWRVISVDRDDQHVLGRIDAQAPDLAATRWSPNGRQTPWGASRAVRASSWLRWRAAWHPRPGDLAGRGPARNKRARGIELLAGAARIDRRLMGASARPSAVGGSLVGCHAAGGGSTCAHPRSRQPSPCPRPRACQGTRRRSGGAAPRCRRARARGTR